MSGTREGTVGAFIKNQWVRGDHVSMNLYYNPQQVNILF